MAVTSTILVATANDGTRIILGTVLMDSSYPTNGEVVAPGDLGLQRITGAVVSSNTGFVPAWDNTNVKMKLFQQSAATSALTEVPNATDVSGTTITGVFFGV